MAMASSSPTTQVSSISPMVRSTLTTVPASSASSGSTSMGSSLLHFDLQGITKVTAATSSYTVCGTFFDGCGIEFAHDSGKQRFADGEIYADDVASFVGEFGVNFDGISSGGCRMSLHTATRQGSTCVQQAPWMPCCGHAGTSDQRWNYLSVAVPMWPFTPANTSTPNTCKSGSQQAA